MSEKDLISNEQIHSEAFDDLLNAFARAPVRDISDLRAHPKRNLEPDAVVGGLYKLRHLLGTGAFGAVWAAEHLPSGHLMALKVMRTSPAPRPEDRKRFEREILTLARLHHQHITTLLDEGFDAHFECRFFVMPT